MLERRSIHARAWLHPRVWFVAIKANSGYKFSSLFEEESLLKLALITEVAELNTRKPLELPDRDLDKQANNFEETLVTHKSTTKPLSFFSLPGTF
uniref:Uncharacterized protein n=1 Tax=Salix viminalis TaxID=40686 RepID=A0A6N2JW40_SALVM